MSYSKQTWDTTSYFNPTRMNHIEDGIYAVDTGKVDKVSGKGLSTNDYTTTDKNQVAKISTLIVARTFESAVTTLNANDNTEVNIPITTPSGYTYLGMGFVRTRWDSQNNGASGCYVYEAEYDSTNNKIIARVHCIYDWQNLKAKIGATVFFIKN